MIAMAYESRLLEKNTTSKYTGSVKNTHTHTYTYVETEEDDTRCAREGYVVNSRWGNAQHTRQTEALVFDGWKKRALRSVPKFVKSRLSW